MSGRCHRNGGLTGQYIFTVRIERDLMSAAITIVSEGVLEIRLIAKRL
jgi:hypothetical protein